jgi:hypothetical protein
MAESWFQADANHQFNNTLFSGDEGNYVHNTIGATNIAIGDLVLVQLVGWDAAAPVRTFSCPGANGLTFARQDSFDSADGKTHAELWWAQATAGINDGAPGAGNRIALPASTNNEDALGVVVHYGRGFDIAAFLASEREGDFSTSFNQTGQVAGVSGTGHSVFYGVISVPSVQHPTGGEFTPAVDFSPGTGDMDFDYPGNGYPGNVTVAWNTDPAGTESIKNNHSGGTEAWHIWAFSARATVAATPGAGGGTQTDRQIKLGRANWTVVPNQIKRSMIDAE